MNSSLLGCLSILFLFCVVSPANEIGRIYFPAEKNGAHLLSQKLEYQVINDDSIKLGNLLINSSDIRIELTDSSEGQPRFAFWGPSQLIKNATLLIRDPTGRSIWSYKINNKELEEAKISDTKIRTNLAVLRMKHADPKMAKNLASTIFFNYCIFYEDDNHRYNLCSRDYRLEQAARTWVLSPIASTKKDFIVQVNGTEVGQEGLVQISEKIKTISFSSRLASGLLLELRTSNIPIEIIDSKWETDTDFADLLIREKNLNDKFNLKNIWASRVDFKQAYFYLEGESQIPLKQEILFDEKPPSERVRPTLINQISKTYSDSLLVDLKKAQETKIKAIHKADNVKNGKTISTWHINKIKIEGSNIHYIEITNQDKKYLGSYEVLKGLPWTSKLYFKGSQINTKVPQLPSESITGSGIEIDLAYYATTFLGLNSNWAQLRWFTELNIQNLGYKSKDGSSINIQEKAINLGYRFAYGFHHETPSLGVTLGFLSRNIQTDTALSPTFGLFYKNPNVNVQLLGDLFSAEFKIAPALQYSQTKLSGNMMRLKFENQYLLRKKDFWLWGFNYQTETIKSKELELPINYQVLELSIGIGRVF